MERSADNLTSRQEHFLKHLVQAKDFETVMRARKVSTILLLRWMTQTAFVEKWERCNRLLSLRRHTETESAAICVAQAQRAQAGSPPPPPCNAADPASQPVPEESEPTPAPEPKPKISERDAIRARHGEEAARAFDRLCQLRKQRETPATPNPAPMPTPQLAGAPQVPISDTPKPPPNETPPIEDAIPMPPESPQPEAQP
ncbi:MAG: hypothetical protein JWN40_4870 [Phycisphaerales bacterium]|nr:hypothetical protein [Phycisphaerales bacterium]